MYMYIYILYIYTYIYLYTYIHRCVNSFQRFGLNLECLCLHVDTLGSMLALVAPFCRSKTDPASNDPPKTITTVAASLAAAVPQAVLPLLWYLCSSLPYYIFFIFDSNMINKIIN